MAQMADNSLLPTAYCLLPKLDETAVVAVSGGADSIFLAETLYRTRLKNSSLLTPHSSLTKLVIAHVNHNLRGAESDADEQFVRDWVEQRQKNSPWLVGRFTRLNIQTDSDGLENACREARYAWLKDVCCNVGARYLFTAHNADDQIETVLFRILRGAGLDGLAGIAPIRVLTEGVTLVRPLLGWTKKQIIEQLDAWNQSYRTDSSNLSSDFSRNKIRNELLPLLEREYNPNVRNSLTNLSTLAAMASAEIDSLADAVLRQTIFRQSDDELILTRQPFRSASQYITMECFRKIWTQRGWTQQAMGLKQWTLLAQMAQSETILPPYVFPGAVRVRVTEELIKLEVLTKSVDININN